MTPEETIEQIRHRHRKETLSELLSSLNGYRSLVAYYENRVLELEIAVRVLMATEPEDEPDPVALSINEAKREAVVQALNDAPNKKAAAKLLGVSPNTLYSHIERFGIVVNGKHVAR